LKLLKLTTGLGVLLLVAFSAAAQSQPGAIVGLEFQTPKNGMVKQYEDGRKQKIEWHKQQKDSQPLLVFETLTGEHTGTYIVGRFGQSWSDMDKPSVPDAADLEQYRKSIAGSVEKLEAAYYEFLPKWSNPSTDMNNKFTEVITFHIRYGKGDDFRSGVAKVHEARQKMNSPSHYSWYRLVSGGPGGTYVLTYDHANWAGMGGRSGRKAVARRSARGLRRTGSDVRYRKAQRRYREHVQRAHPVPSGLELHSSQVAPALSFVVVKRTRILVD
jgi:hypothetical protein